MIAADENVLDELQDQVSDLLHDAEDSEALIDAMGDTIADNGASSAQFLQ